MAFIRTVPEADATDEVRALYERDRKRLGYVPNYTKVFSARPDAFHAWVNLNGAVKACMDLRRYELVTLAAARALRSSYCCLAHGNVLRREFFSDEEVERLVRGDGDADISEAERAMMRFAEKVTLRPYEISQRDVDALRAHGFADEDVLDIVLAAAARNFFSRVLDAVGALPDAAYAASLPDSLREVLTVGRAIEEGDVGAY